MKQNRPSIYHDDVYNLRVFASFGISFEVDFGIHDTDLVVLEFVCSNHRIFI